MIIQSIEGSMARTSEINQKMKDERRKEILSNALHLFSTKGLTATKIADIASYSGFAQGLVYHYFSSKEEIFIELISTSLDRMNEACIGLEKLILPADEKIKLALNELIKGLDSNEDTSKYHLLIAHSSVSEAIPDKAKEIIKKKNQLPYQVIKKIMLEGQSNGTVKNYDAEMLSQLFWATIKGLAIHRAVHKENYKTPDVNVLYDMFLINNKVL